MITFNNFLLKPGHIAFIALWLLCMINSNAQQQAAVKTFASTEKPWVWWFWMGNVVTEKDIRQQLLSFKQSGFGGAVIISTYSVKGFEHREIRYGSEEWYKMIAYTTATAKNVGLQIDLALSSAWPFGGATVTEKMGAKMLKNYTTFFSEGGKTTQQLAVNNDEFIITVTATSRKGVMLELTKNVSDKNLLTATLPNGNWTIHVLTGAYTNQKVKRSSLGGDGLVVDYFSASAMNDYLNNFNANIASLKDIRSGFNDSYEVYSADYTTGIFETFEEKRGYSLQPYFPLLFDSLPSETSQRVLCDYRETIADLLYDGFMQTWASWSCRHQMFTTEQAHGSPGNVLDLYGAADIPQTESFGSSHFNIPGVRVDVDSKRERYKWPDKLMFKFASSAANVKGRKLCSSETATWLTNHFRMALSQLKPQVDELFIAGINHIMLISVTNVPYDVEFPGWVFYPAPDFGRYSAYYDYLPSLSNYITRSQHLLQNSTPDNDVLVYFPIYDYWSEAPNDLGVLATFDHIPTKWQDKFAFSKTIRDLWNNGYSFDYISDKQIQNSKAGNNKIITEGGLRYKTILIPDCKRIPVETCKKLQELASQGISIIFENHIPNDIPGNYNVQEQLSVLSEAMNKLRNMKNVFVSKNIDETLQQIKCSKESFRESGLEFIRKKIGNEIMYYVANLDKRFEKGFIKLNSIEGNISLYNAITDKTTTPITEKRKDGVYVYLELLPGQSCFLFTDSKTQYTPQDYYSGQNNYTLQTDWHVTFEKGAPHIPPPIKMKELKSWTEAGDTPAQFFSGTACYTTNFDLPVVLKQSKTIRLRFEELRDMADVYLNGMPVGKTWSVPYIIDIDSKLFKEKNNALQIHVTNLSANRIIWMDKQKIPWKTFYIADLARRQFDASDWDVLPSGIIGTVELTGCK